MTTIAPETAPRPAAPESASPDIVDYYASAQTVGDLFGRYIKKQVEVYETTTPAKLRDQQDNNQVTLNMVGVYAHTIYITDRLKQVLRTSGRSDEEVSEIVPQEVADCDKAALFLGAFTHAQRSAESLTEQDYSAIKYFAERVPAKRHEALQQQLATSHTKDLLMTACHGGERAHAYRRLTKAAAPVIAPSPKAAERLIALSEHIEAREQHDYALERDRKELVTLIGTETVLKVYEKVSVSQHAADKKLQKALNDLASKADVAFEVITPEEYIERFSSNAGDAAEIKSDPAPANKTAQVSKGARQAVLVERRNGRTRGAAAVLATAAIVGAGATVSSTPAAAATTHSVTEAGRVTIGNPASQEAVSYTFTPDGFQPADQTDVAETVDSTPEVRADETTTKTPVTASMPEADQVDETDVAADEPAVDAAESETADRPQPAESVDTLDDSTDAPDEMMPEDTQDNPLEDENGSTKPANETETSETNTEHDVAVEPEIAADASEMVPEWGPIVPSPRAAEGYTATPEVPKSVTPDSLTDGVLVLDAPVQPAVSAETTPEGEPVVQVQVPELQPVLPSGASHVEVAPVTTEHGEAHVRVVVPDETLATSVGGAALTLSGGSAALGDKVAAQQIATLMTVGAPAPAIAAEIAKTLPKAELHTREDIAAWLQDNTNQITERARKNGVPTDDLTMALVSAEILMKFPDYASTVDMPPHTDEAFMKQRTAQYLEQLAGENGYTDDVKQTLAALLASADAHSMTKEERTAWLQEQGVERPGAKPKANSDSGKEAATPANIKNTHPMHTEDLLVKRGVPRDFAQYYVRYGREYNIDPVLLAAQGKQESSFRTNAVSHAGAAGPAQIMPGTWREIARELGFPDSARPSDLNYGIKAQAYYMRKQLDAFDGDMELALAAYNAGAGNVRKHNGIPPFSETQHYVKVIQSNAKQWKMLKTSDTQQTLRYKLQQRKDVGKIISQTSTKVPIPAAIGKVAYYSQWDERWHDKSYNGSGTQGRTISSSGCGPATQAMVISTLSDKKITPLDMARWNQQHGYRASVGTAHEAFLASAKAYGIEARQIKVELDDIKKVLKRGGLVIVNGRDQDPNTPATSSGHIYLIRGIDKDGKLLISDANSVTKSIKSWRPGRILGPATAAFAFER